MRIYRNWYIPIRFKERGFIPLSFYNWLVNYYIIISTLNNHLNKSFDKFIVSYYLTIMIIKSASNYYKDIGSRKLSHRAKNGDFEAIKEMAYKMAPLISKDSHLIPIPNRMGIANMTLQLVIEINKITGNPISNIIKGKNRASVYDIKKLGKILEPNTLGFYLNDMPPKKSTLIDNVYATGYTMQQALSLVKNSDIVVYSRDYSLMIN